MTWILIAMLQVTEIYIYFIVQICLRYEMPACLTPVVYVYQSTRIAVGFTGRDIVLGFQSQAGTSYSGSSHRQGHLIRVPVTGRDILLGF